MTPDEPLALLRDARSGHWLRFERPLAVLEARRLSEVMPVLEQVALETGSRNRWAAGFLAYEAAPACDPALAVRPADPTLPLAWFALFDRPVPDAREAWPLPPPAPAPEWEPDTDEAAYAAAIRRIKDHIRAGDTYQVNYTIRLHAPLRQRPRDLFTLLIEAQEPAYGAFLQAPDWSLCSASPELFLDWDGDTLLSKPMKGTRPRGLHPAEDRRLAAELRASEKDRAEHVMIVDMARNDMGRLARTGSVRVDRPFEAEGYPTVWQLTSEVRCETGEGLPGILRALFPAASITGAPKARTMSLISELETSPRGAYTGALGFVAPGRRAQFNVAIRTVRTDRAAGRAEYGAGGGIVWDSGTADEREECRVKARILTRRLPPFDLLETLLWTPAEGYLLLERHLDRLADAASAFGFAADPAALRAALARAADAFPPAPQRVRLVVPKIGFARIAAEPLRPLPAPFRVAPAREPVDPADPFLYHKTTHRAAYERARAGVAADDALLWNRRGELTETTIANVLVFLDGAWCTPPVSCGLLGGVYRADLLARGAVRERVIRMGELGPASRIRLVNAVRREWDAILVPGS